MFGLNFMCDILSGPTCLIKGVIYLRIMYQFIKSPNTLNLAMNAYVARSNVDWSLLNEIGVLVDCLIMKESCALID